MGCTNSKETLRRAGVAGDERPGIRSLPRCLSTPIPHSKDTEDRKYHHLVSLNSATYGDLDINMNEEKEAVFLPRKQEYREGFYGNNHRGNFDRSSSLVAKTWSDVNGLLSDYKQKNAPAADHRRETKEEEEEELPVMIDARELMEGLEDDDHNRNFSFDLEISEKDRKPLWMHLADDSPDSLFDPETVSGFRKALGELSPCSAVSVSGTLKSINEPETPVSACSSRLQCTSFARPINKAPLNLPEPPRTPDFENQSFGMLRAPPRGEYRVVLYFTSLRAIRKTYEDCCYVRLILQGFRIFVDERDVSLHAEYRHELQRLLGTERISVPMLFIRGECIGGADRVIQLHEEGELEKYLEGFPVMSCIRVCDGCGDLRFVPCPSCHGSCKLYTDEDELIRCPDCNENGLIRCSVCY